MMEVSKDQISSKEDRKLGLLALLAFFGLCLEAVQCLVEKRIYGVDITQFAQDQFIRHWQIVIPIWFLVSILVILLSKKKCNYNVFESHPVRRKWQLVCGIAIPVLFAVLWSCLNGGPGFYRFYTAFPAKMFVYQYIYYVFEMLLAGLIISLSQKANDNMLGKASRFPWGGLVLGLSWGLMHYFTKGGVFIAVFAFVIAVFFGVVFNWVGKDLKKAWPLMYLVFVCF